MEEGKGERYLASGRQYGNALLGVRHQEEAVALARLEIFLAHPISSIISEQRSYTWATKQFFALIVHIVERSLQLVRPNK